MTETPTWSNQPPQGPRGPQGAGPGQVPASPGQRGSFQSGQVGGGSGVAAGSVPGGPSGGPESAAVSSGGQLPAGPPPVGSVPAAIPLGPVRVNLLPGQYRHRLSIMGAQRRAKIAVGCTVGVVLLISMISFIQAGLSTSDLNGAKGEQISAQQAVNKYAEVPRLSSQLSEIKTGLTDALAAEVLFSEMIKSVGKTLPSGVSISSLTFSLAAASGESAASGGGSASGGSAGAPAIGLLSINGTAPSLESISTFIENLEASEEFDTVTLTSATRSSSGSTSNTYTFSGTANMGQGALSGRYAKDGIKPQ